MNAGLPAKTCKCLIHFVYDLYVQLRIAFIIIARIRCRPIVVDLQHILAQVFKRFISYLEQIQKDVVLMPKEEMYSWDGLNRLFLSIV